MGEGKPRFFRSAAEWRAWLDKNHDKADELWVGYHRTATGKPSMTWAESVDEALCYGWIDGLRKSVDVERYKIRFTPRRGGSNWSVVNINRVQELTALGLMQPAGRKAFEERRGDRSGIYAYEQRKTAALDRAQQKLFRANKPAWEFFAVQPPSYRRLMAYWVNSAKRDETRERRLQKLIDESAAGRRVM